MIETRYPGVYLTEVPFSAKPIEGVSTSAENVGGMTSFERIAHSSGPGVVADATPRRPASDSESKYLSLRRYEAYVGESIGKAIQFAAFEPNGEPLWDNVRTAISDFLFNEWQAGRLQGERPEQAYFVQCDRSTMTQNDLDNGRLVVLVGVATLKPGEFVILRFSTATGSGDK